MPNRREDAYQPEPLVLPHPDAPLALANLADAAHGYEVLKAAQARIPLTHRVKRAWIKLELRRAVKAEIAAEREVERLTT